MLKSPSNSAVKKGAAGVAVIAAVVGIFLMLSKKPAPDVQPAQVAAKLPENKGAAEKAQVDLPKAAPRPEKQQPGSVESETPSIEQAVDPEQQPVDPENVMKEKASKDEAVQPTAPETDPSKPKEVVVSAPEVFDRPTFDLVRVDPQGAAVIAGKAAAGSQVQITLADRPLETVRTDASGAFVALLQLSEGDEPMTVGLQQLMGANKVVASAQTVLIVPPPVTLGMSETMTPTVVLADNTGAEVLQSSDHDAQAPSTKYPLSLDAISYDTVGDVVLAGRAQGEQFVRVYVDNTPIETEVVADNGSWRVVLPEIKQGVYTLRVDQITAGGDVTSRVESPFQRVSKTDVTTELKQSVVTVQPGNTLWALAKESYGDGVRYVQILNANKDRIRNPDLIYPGQIFDIPTEN